MSRGVRSVRGHFSISHLSRTRSGFPYRWRKARECYLVLTLPPWAVDWTVVTVTPQAAQPHLSREAETKLRFTLIPNSAVTLSTVGFKPAQLNKVVWLFGYWLQISWLIKDGTSQEHLFQKFLTALKVMFPSQLSAWSIYRSSFFISAQSLFQFTNKATDWKRKEEMLIAP